MPWNKQTNIRGPQGPAGPGAQVGEGPDPTPAPVGTFWLDTDGPDSPAGITQDGADARYVMKTGDTMTGNLGVGGAPADFGATSRNVKAVSGAGGYASLIASAEGRELQMLANNANGVAAMGTRSNHDLTICTNDTTRMTVSASGAFTMSDSLTVQSWARFNSVLIDNPSGNTDLRVQAAAENWKNLLFQGQDGSDRWGVQVPPDSSGTQLRFYWRRPDDTRGQALLMEEINGKARLVGERSTDPADPALTVATKDYVDSKVSGGNKVFAKILTWTRDGTYYRHNLTQTFGITVIEGFHVTPWASASGLLVAVADGNMSNFGIALQNHDGAFLRDDTVQLSTIVVGR